MVNFSSIIFAITNNDALASLSFVELCTYVRVSLGLYLEVRFLGQRVCLSQHYERVPNNFLEWFLFLFLFFILFYFFFLRVILVFKSCSGYRFSSRTAGSRIYSYLQLYVNIKLLSQESSQFTSSPTYHCKLLHCKCLCLLIRWKFVTYFHLYFFSVLGILMIGCIYI